MVGSEGQLKGYKGQQEGSEGQLEGSGGQPEGCEVSQRSLRVRGGTYGLIDEGMDGQSWTYIQNFSLDYRTLSPIGAAAQKAE